MTPATAQRVDRAGDAGGVVEREARRRRAERHARDAAADRVEQVHGVAVGAEADAAAAVGADLHPAGTLAPNQAALNVFATAGWPSRKITDSPAAIVVTPFRAIALAKLLELSSTLKPVMSAGWAPVFVSSNQSAPYGLLPLLQGAASVTMSEGATAPGEPVAPPTVYAPLRPATLRAVTVAALAELSNVKRVVEAPKRDAGHAVAAGVEQVHGVAVGAEADARSRCRCRPVATYGRTQIWALNSATWRRCPR